MIIEQNQAASIPQTKLSDLGCCKLLSYKPIVIIIIIALADTFYHLACFGVLYAVGSCNIGEHSIIICTVHT